MRLMSVPKDSGVDLGNFFSLRYRFLSDVSCQKEFGRDVSWLPSGY